MHPLLRLAFPELGGEDADVVVAARKEQLVAERLLLVGDGAVADQLLGADDGEVEAGLGGVVEVDAVEHLAAGLGQPEGDVGDAQHGAGPGEAFLQLGDGIDGLGRRAAVVVVAGGAGEDQRVPDDVLGRDAVLLGQQLVAALGDLDLGLGGDRLALLVDAADHQGGAVLVRQRRHRREPGLTVLEVDGVEDDLALRIREGGLEHRDVGGVDHQRHLHQLDRDLQEVLHVADLIGVGVAEADIDEVGARLDLGPGDLGGLLPLLVHDQPLELAAADDVGALADDQRPARLLALDVLDAADVGDLPGGRQLPGLVGAGGGADGANELRSGAAAAADEV